ncbi:hypothetical protein D3C84_667090 [compost metagenome]
MTQRKQLIRPLAPGHLEFEQGGPSFHQALRDQLGGLFTRDIVALAGEQATYSRQQCRRAAPVAANPIQRIALHRVAEHSPVIAQDLAQQIAVIGFQGLGEQAATVERVLAQHALAPTVDGRNGGFVHPLGGDIQAVCAAGPLLGQVLIAQLGNQRVRCRGFLAEEPCSLGQTRANALAQFFGGRIGEGHDEDLRG